MTRRGFFKGLLQSAALIAAVKIGLGNLTTENVENEVAAGMHSDIEWILDADMDEDRIYFMQRPT